MKEERLFRVLGMLEDDLIKEAEDEKSIGTKMSAKTAVWKWAAAAAGILLIAGAGLSQGYLFTKNNTSTTAENCQEAAAAGAASELKEKQETAAALYDHVVSEGRVDAEQENAEEGISVASSAESAFFETKEEGGLLSASYESLYLKIIKEVYEPYEGKILYLNLEKVSNLEPEQKEILLDELADKYGIQTITGTFEEFCSQGIIDKEAEEYPGIYLSLEVTEQKEDSFLFSVYIWTGKNHAAGRENCYAEYSQKGWSYDLGEMWTY